MLNLPHSSIHKSTWTTCRKTKGLCAQTKKGRHLHSQRRYSNLWRVRGGLPNVKREIHSVEQMELSVREKRETISALLSIFLSATFRTLV
jgi:hypothetical protein